MVSSMHHQDLLSPLGGRSGGSKLSVSALGLGSQASQGRHRNLTQVTFYLVAIDPHTTLGQTHWVGLLHPILGWDSCNILYRDHNSFNVYCNIMEHLVYGHEV